MNYAIAIDGPAGAGKSTIAKVLAKELKLIYVDTGALYRSIGYYVTRQGIALEDTESIVAVLDSLKVELRYVDGIQRVFVNGEDVSDYIRTPAISMAASAVSAIPAVREYLLATQRDIAAHNSVVMDGRDIGTVILPDAKVKIFLTASAESRATRRFAELQEKGDPATYEEVLADMVKRDYDDSHRATAPLKQAEDAVLVDTSGETLEQSVARMKAIVLKKLAE
ncbi:MAG: (d)CMP kinase [Ruminococcaceae bacterium]|nr:(d)CMP kinase [Oscillospiraceae bacterium]